MLAVVETFTLRVNWPIARKILHPEYILLSVRPSGEIYNSNKRVYLPLKIFIDTLTLVLLNRLSTLGHHLWFWSMYYEINLRHGTQQITRERMEKISSYVENKEDNRKKWKLPKYERTWSISLLTWGHCIQWTSRTSFLVITCKLRSIIVLVITLLGQIIWWSLIGCISAIIIIALDVSGAAP